MKDKNNLVNIAKSALNALPNEKGFYFYSDFNKPTGLVARNLHEFISVLKKVDLKSIEFHAKRRDFSNWIFDTLKDKYLATNLANIKDNGEVLRKKIIEIVESRYNALSNSLK